MEKIMYSDIAGYWNGLSPLCDVMSEGSMWSFLEDDIVKKKKEESQLKHFCLNLHIMSAIRSRNTEEGLIELINI